MANKRKILEAARKHAQKGAKDKALREYEKLLKLDPKDARLRIEVGDAYRRWGQTEDAIAIYGKVAQQYMVDGFDARAVAVFKQIQNLDPEHWAIYEPLGELYQRMGLTAEAINTLQTAADGHHRAGDKREALALLRKMATIDPSNTASRLKVADLLHQESMNDEAIAEYQAAVAELSRQGEQEQAGQALERILEIDPNHLAALPGLVENLSARGLHEQAEPFAKRAIENAPEDPEHYERLAEVYRAQQRADALEDVYRRMAEVYRLRGDDDRARDIIQRFVSPDGFELKSEPELDDDGVLDGDVSEFLSNDDFGPETLLEEEFIPAEDSSPEGASIPAPVAEETVLVEGAAAAPELDDSPSLQEIADDAQPSIAPTTDLGVEGALEPVPEGDPDQLLAEACVYLRYGKHAQAVSNLQAILVTDPGHRGALEKLGEAYAEGDESEQAVVQWMKAADRAREDGDHSALAVLRDRIGALDEVAAGGLAPAVGESDPEIDLELSDSDIDLGEVEAELAEAVDDDLDLGELEIDVDDSELDEVGLDADLDLDLDEDVDTSISDELVTDDLEESLSGAGASASLSIQIGEDLEEADFYIQQGLLDEAEAIYERILEGAPNHPQVLVRLGEIAATRGGDPGSISSGRDAATSEPEARLDVPDVEREPAEMPGEGLDGPVDLDDWTDGGSDDLALDVIDPDESVAAASEVDPNAETDIDFDIEAKAEADAHPESVDEGAPGTATADEAALGIEGVPGEELVSLDLDEGPEEEIAPDDDDASDDIFADVDLDDASEDGVAASPPPNREPEALEADFDLAAELSDAFDADPGGASATGTLASADDGFAAAFQEFKKGVQDALSDGDHQAHYDLGIAYREMGLLDDAMGEFRAAMGDDARRLDCLQMLGLCSLERECGEEAVAHFQQALALDGLGDDQLLALRFELGRAFEHVGEVAQAREAWEAVVAANASFCDVAERLAGLEDLDKPEAAPEVEADTSPTESYESFEDLIGEVEAENEEPSEEAHVDFDDLVAEANAEDDDDASQADGTADAESHQEFQDLLNEFAADPEESPVEVDAIDESEPAPAPDAEPLIEPEPKPVKPPRKKKKISFV